MTSPNRCLSLRQLKVGDRFRYAYRGGCSREFHTLLAKPADDSHVLIAIQGSLINQGTCYGETPVYLHEV